MTSTPSVPPTAMPQLATGTSSEPVTGPIHTFYSNHWLLVWATFGTALIVFSLFHWLGRAVCWILTPTAGTVKTVHDTALPLPLLPAEPPRPLPSTGKVGPEAPTPGWLARLFGRRESAQPLPIRKQASFLRAFAITPPFNFYQIPGFGTALRCISKRPSTLLTDAYFAGTGITTTQPGDESPFFRYHQPPEEVAKVILRKAHEDPDGVVSVRATGKTGWTLSKDEKTVTEGVDLTQGYGTNAFTLSNREIADLSCSLRIHTSRMLPHPFCLGFKKALSQDHIEEVPASLLRDFLPSHGLLARLKGAFASSSAPSVRAFLAEVEKDPVKFGFLDAKHFNWMCDRSFDEVGAMCVKTQDFHVMIDGEGHILQRNPGDPDAIRLLDVSGIRPRKTLHTEPDLAFELMTQTFLTALEAAGDGFVFFPAIGQGVWGGDPHIYGRALCEAIRRYRGGLKYIGINPAHRPTPYGRYKGRGGDEFAEILQECMQTAIREGDTQGLANLELIHNLFGEKKDLIQLARNMKAAYPEETVAIANASDPDVVLGPFTVGEYTHGVCSASTTEENYFASGTNCFSFEAISNYLKSTYALSR